MAEVFFYHLTRRGLADVLPPLLERALAQGWRVALRGTDEGHLRQLDGQLWLAGEESFLPHGLAGSGFDAAQPVLLTTAQNAPNKAKCVMAIDGAEIAAGEVAGLSRACILFDGNDDGALNQARGQWKRLTGAGIGAQYWSEESGRWEKKAEHSTT